MSVRSRYARSLALAILSALGLLGLSACGSQAGVEKAEIERIIRDYLVEHPEVLVEAMQALERKEQEAANQQQTKALDANRDALENAATSPVGGNPQGDVTMVEFFDYNCGYCKRTHGERLAALEKDKKVRLVYKELPVLSPVSEQAAKAALAAHRQGRYEAMHDALMTHEGRLDDKAIQDAAKKAGLDWQRLQDDMTKPEIQAEIDANLALARAIGLKGTPGFIIGEAFIPGAIPADQFAILFQSAREAAKAAKATKGGG
jgi:protein-disulfide isomerase